MFSNEAKEYLATVDLTCADPMWDKNYQAVESWAEFLGYDSVDEYLYQEYGVESEKVITAEEKLMVLYQIGITA